MWRIDNRTEQRESCVRHVKFEGGRQRERERGGRTGRLDDATTTTTWLAGEVSSFRNYRGRGRPLWRAEVPRRGTLRGKSKDFCCGGSKKWVGFLWELCRKIPGLASREEMGDIAKEVGTIGGIATVSVLHSFIPTHWLPFSIVGRAQNWSISRILLVSKFPLLNPPEKSRIVNSAGVL